MDKQTQNRRARGLRRMGIAIDRGIAAKTGELKDRAIRWVALWAVVGGIRDATSIRRRKKP